MDYEGWRCWILLHIFLSLPTLGLMCSSRGSATIPSMQRCEQQMPEDSCEGRCGHRLNRNESCQCNTVCLSFNDCCYDYNDTCETCEGRCDINYDFRLPCQCNDECGQYGNCCDDYMEVCPTEVALNIKPTHVCSVTTYYSDDVLLSNDTVWTCIGNGDTSLHWFPSCNCPVGFIDVVVNLTRGVTTKINCSLVSKIPTSFYVYKWRMDAPIGSKIRLRVHHFDGENTIRATDVADSSNTHRFSANISFSDGYSFMSSSNAVNMEATFSDSSHTPNFIVIGQTVDNDVNMEATFSDSSHTPNFIITGQTVSDDDSNNVVIPIVIVLLIFLLVVAVVLGVKWCKSRHPPLKPDDKSQLPPSVDDLVINPSLRTAASGDQNDLVSSSANPTALSTAIHQQKNSEADRRISSSAPRNNVVIYNEVGEENYNVLFGGKEHGDYHTYSLPDSGKEMQKADREQTEVNSDNSSPTDPYDVLQKGIKVTEHSSTSGYYCLEPTTETKFDTDYETPGNTPKKTSDYEDPVKGTNAVNEAYDHLRHQTALEAAHRADDVAADSRPPYGAEEDATNTYQTLDDRLKQTGDEEYSHLQRPLGIKALSDQTSIQHTINQHGELKGNI